MALKVVNTIYYIYAARIKLDRTCFQSCKYILFFNNSTKMM